jgi:hypothetical protein
MLRGSERDVKHIRGVFSAYLHGMPNGGDRLPAAGATPPKKGPHTVRGTKTKGASVT